MNPILKNYARIVPTRKSQVLMRPRDAYRGTALLALRKVRRRVSYGVEPEASSNKTQSLSPSWLLPGGVNCRVPVFANGAPAMPV
jgi:hypothetical protein